MSLATQGYGDQGAVVTQGYGAGVFTALPQVVKLTMSGKKANIDFTGNRSEILFSGKRANTTFTKVDC